MYKLPRIISKIVENFEVYDFKEWLKKEEIEIYLRPENPDHFICHRCKTPLTRERGKYPIRVQTFPILNIKTYLVLWRRKGDCPHCKKARSEDIPFLSFESPHLEADYAWWLGHLCEISAVSKAAKFSGHDKSTLYRLDEKRMKRMLQFYKIPPLKRISVDEVYSRKKSNYKSENRDKRFFTIITDLNTRRVVWVSEGRNKESLDQFFQLIGPERCKEIEVVATDQHDPYRRSVKDYCPNAKVVWDKFHLLQSFEKAINETRKYLHDHLRSNTFIKMNTSGRYKYIFLKREYRRTEKEKKHINSVLRRNDKFCKLELIKERMISVFYENSAEIALSGLEEVGEWIKEAGFRHLEKWHRYMMNDWETIKNYFEYKVTSALSEGINNVIKMVKRRAFGYRNMEYFKLKILQVCGFLNSTYCPNHNELSSMSF